MEIIITAILVIASGYIIFKNIKNHLKVIVTAEAVHQIALVVKSKSSENSRYSSFFVFLHFSFLTFIFL